MSEVSSKPQSNVAIEARINEARLDGELGALAHMLYGQLAAVETMFGGDLAPVGMTLDSALNKFLIEVGEAGGKQAADAYARILIKSMSKFLVGGK